MWFRVDNRLVHGQVIEAWLPYTGARHLVVANDELADDIMRQQIIELAVPQRVMTHFINVKELAATLNSCGMTVLCCLPIVRMRGAPVMRAFSCWC